MRTPNPQSGSVIPGKYAHKVRKMRTSVKSMAIAREIPIRYRRSSGYGWSFPASFASRKSSSGIPVESSAAGFGSVDAGERIRWPLTGGRQVLLAARRSLAGVWRSRPAHPAGRIPGDRAAVPPAGWNLLLYIGRRNLNWGRPARLAGS
jgi:hypothetical protein